MNRKELLEETRNITGRRYRNELGKGTRKEFTEENEEETAKKTELNGMEFSFMSLWFLTILVQFELVFINPH